MINVIKLSQPNCIPCKVLSNYLTEIDFAEHNATLTEINISEQKEYIEKYRLSGVPALVYERNGSEVHRINGLASVEEIVEAIEFARRAK